MKSKETGPGNMKGFYTALFACVGAVVVLALVISFSNLTSGPNPEMYAAGGEDNDETVLAGAYTARPYTAQAAQDQNLLRPRPTPAAAPAPAPAQTPAAPAAPAMPRPIPTPPAAGPAPTALPGTQPGAQAPPAAIPTPAASPMPAAPAPEAAAEPAVEIASFTPFTEDERMAWPVYGDIVMPFSQDRLIFNPTLDQWRVNDDLRIAAQEGTPVRAAAAGKVTEIGSDRIFGNFVRVYSGNGWETIYGQLMDGILVEEGDIVESGQVIGGVGRPSVFSVLNGHHVSLRVLQNDNLIDPKMVLAALEE